MYSHSLSFLIPTRSTCLVTILSCCAPLFAQPHRTHLSDIASQCPSNEAVEELHHLIIERGQSIKENLITVVDQQSAMTALPLLQKDYKLICKYLAAMNKHINNQGYHLMFIKKSSRQSTRLFGKISLISIELLEGDAYGCEGLAVFLKKFCPEPDFDMNRVAASD